MKITLNKASLLLVILSAIVPFGLPPAVRYCRQLLKPKLSQDSRMQAVIRLPASLAVDLSALPTAGSTSAKVAVVEFSDFECPFCRHHANAVWPEIERELVGNGKIKYAFSNNPLDMHPTARALAYAAYCAGDQGRFWQMYRELFKIQPRDAETIRQLALHVVPDVFRFDQCLESDAPSRQVEADLEVAKKLQLEGTPAFGIGRMDVNGRVKVETIIRGTQQLDLFRTTIDQLLRQPD